MAAPLDTTAHHGEPDQADAGPADPNQREPKAAPPARGGIRVRRLRTIEDLEPLAALFAEAHEATWNGRIPLNFDKGRTYFRRVLDDPAHHILLAADRIPDGDSGQASADGGAVRTVGLLLGVAGPHMAADAWIASTRIFFVAPEIRRGLRGGEAALRLLRGFKSWAARVGPDGKGAAAIEIHVTSADDAPRSDKLFRRLGLTPIGGSYGAMTGGGA
ncbi:MAG: hypothetical protein QNJ42_22355 [Crocosphaera sp.]|nr:hypothetical protein [Crocosphaera sp.]MDJ0686805.1 hypothetical protein [Alphaproteobacteria bacterium]